MDPRFAAAEAAFQANRASEGLALLQAALTDNPKGPVVAYRRVSAALLGAKQYAEARKWVEAGLEVHRRDFDLWNNLGVIHRRLGGTADALKALDEAQKLNPKSQAPLINRVNVLNDAGDGARALESALKLVRQSPTNAEFQRMTATAHRHLHEWDKARTRLEAAVRLQPALTQAWTDLCSLETTLQHHDQAVAAAERALKANPDAPAMLEGKAVLLRRAGRKAEAEAFLTGVLAGREATAWAHYQLGRTIADAERVRANVHFRRAVELAPKVDDYRLMLADNLERTRVGDEGANIEESYAVLRDFQDAGGKVPDSHANVARQIALRVGDYDRLAGLGSLKDVGRNYVRLGHHGPLLGLIGRVQTAEDRVELLHQHKMWGDQAIAQASRNPVVRPQTKSPDAKIRLGFLSSDLRGHPVAYFASPLFEFIDKSRFDVFCYSFYLGREDETQKFISSRVTAFRWAPNVADRDAAQMVANDELDMLFELGGSTHMNKLDVMAYKPAPIQASWLGYPHSAGLTTIDYLMVDPYTNPEKPGLLLERPLMMPKTWISLGVQAFRETDVVNPQTPEERLGRITFGTANNPHKYGPEMLAVWAQVVRAVPNSRFLFVRPEGGAPSFQAHMTAAFVREGVEAERVQFATVRGHHLPFYNEIDIALDTFPLTGGTTTCETLWMGVPVVSLLGDAFFERLSYSILSNAGLGDLVARSVDEYVVLAKALAADPERRRRLRVSLRDDLKASPLGQRETFARDFYDLIAATVAERRAARTS